MSDIKAMYRTVMADHFPPEMTISFGDQKLIYRKRTWKLPDAKGEVIEMGLRYGENPGQEAALYEMVGGHLTLGECHFLDPNNGFTSAIDEAAMVQAGKHPGKTNLTDLDNGLNIIKWLQRKPAAVILKHNNPCGAAWADSLAAAYDKANMADRIAAFGGAAVFNRPVDKATAELVAQNYLEVLAAPDFEAGTLDILKKAKDLRIIKIPRFERLVELIHHRFVDFKCLVDGGIIVQQSPLNAIRGQDDFKPAVATHKGQEYRCVRQPSAAEYEDLLFGWWVEQGITSNSVIFVKDGATVGIGTGEQDRVGVAEIAVFKAYTKYADALCFKQFGMPYKNLETGNPPGQAGLLGPDRHRRGHPGGQRRPHRLGHDLGRLLPLQGRGGRGHPPGRHRGGPRRRLGPGLRSHRGLQRSRPARGHGVHRAAVL